MDLHDFGVSQVSVEIFLVYQRFYVKDSVGEILVCQDFFEQISVSEMAVLCA